MFAFLSISEMLAKIPVRLKSSGPFTFIHFYPLEFCRLCTSITSEHITDSSFSVFLTV